MNKTLIEANAVKRKAILAYLEQNGGKATVMAFSVPKSTIYYWRKSYQQFGDEGLKPRSRRPKKLGRQKVTRAMEDFIKNYNTKNPKAALSIIQRTLQKENFGKVSRMTIWRVLHPKTEEKSIF